MRILNIITLLFLSAFLALFPELAFAAPQFRSGFQGSNFYIFATNSEQKGYNCNYSYTFSYSDFGEVKQRTINGVLFVASGVADQQVLQTTGSWVNPQLQGGVGIQCVMVN